LRPKSNWPTTRLAQIQRIQQYLDNLTAGSQSTLSPSDRLAAAQSQFTSQLGAAKSGDATAIQNITSYSDNLLQAARDYYGSSVGYQSILAQVQASLTGLIGTGLSGSVSSSGLPGTGSIPGVSTPTTTPVAANTNSLSAVVSAVNDLSGKVVVLQTKLDGIKSSVDAGNSSNANGMVDEGKKLDAIVTNTSRIGTISATALAASR
jgi:outer membrane murein-binding lipoprotein Lpp